MAKNEPELGNIADYFKSETTKRLGEYTLDSETSLIFDIIQEETYKALRLLENAIISQK